MTERQTAAPYLVLGLGNVLLFDDGVGVELLKLLQAELGEDPRFEFIDGGTQGVALLGCWEGRRGVLLLDAEQRGSRPGTVHVSNALAVASHARGDTAHGCNAAELLAVVQLTGAHAGPTLLVGVEPSEVRTGYGLSEPVRRAIPEALDAARVSLALLVRDTGPLIEEVTSCTS